MNLQYDLLFNILIFTLLLNLFVFITSG